MKLLLRFLSLLLASSLLSGCSSDEYRIVNENSNYYIVLRNRTGNADNLHNAHYCMNEFGIIATLSSDPIPAPVIFKSAEEMAEDISTGNFSGDEMQIIASFYTDDSGRIPICNPETLYVPIFPDSYEKYDINWYGERYTVSIQNSNATQKAFFTLVEDQAWERQIRNLQNYEKHLASWNWVMYLVVERDVQSGTTVYRYSRTEGDSTPDRKECTYFFDRDGNTYYIHEIYDLKASETIPTNVFIYGAYHDQCFYFSIIEPENRPSIDWLSQFGLKEYIYNPAS